MGFCYFKRRRIGSYLDGALPEREGRTLAAHLARCAGCRSEAEGLGHLRGLVASSAALAEPDWTGFWPGVVRGIEASTPLPVRPRSRRHVEARRVAVAGAFVAALLAIVIWHSGDSLRIIEGPSALAAAETEYPDGSVMVYSPPGDDMTVIWVFGPENHAASAI